MTTDTPRTDACPHCGAPYSSCGTNQAEGAEEDSRTELCFQRYARQKAEAEVERLRHLLTESSYRINEPDFVREIEETLNQNNK